MKYRIQNRASSAPAMIGPVESRVGQSPLGVIDIILVHLSLQDQPLWVCLVCRPLNN